MNPEWKIYGAETSSATRSRGVYTHPYTYNLSTQYDDLQQSSYDNDYVAWGRSAEDSWVADRDLKHLAGNLSGLVSIILASLLLTIIHSLRKVPISALLILLVSLRIFSIIIKANGKRSRWCIFCLIGIGLREKLFEY